MTDFQYLQADEEELRIGGTKDVPESVKAFAGVNIQKPPALDEDSAD